MRKKLNIISTSNISRYDKLYDIYIDYEYYPELEEWKILYTSISFYFQISTIHPISFFTRYESDGADDVRVIDMPI